MKRAIAPLLTLLVLTSVPGCSRDGDGEKAKSWWDWSSPEIQADKAKPIARGNCDNPIPVFVDGKRSDALCEENAKAAGLTVLDLSDNWAPHLFARYRDRYVTLANERWPKDAEGYRAGHIDQYLELYGIFPSMSVLRARLVDDERHACHDQVDDRGLDRATRSVDPWSRTKQQQRGDRVIAKRLRKRLEHGKEKKNLGSIEALKNDKKYARTYDNWSKLSRRGDAVEAMQGHLVCDGMLSKRHEAGIFNYHTTDAMHSYQRRHMIVTWQIDKQTREALLSDSRELDFQGMLRSLRERVVDSTGLIEDGSARNQFGTVVGRVLDRPNFRAKGADEPAPNGAPDAISKATDAAAKALGWVGPAEARQFFEALEEGALDSLKVAVRLPPVPSYHKKGMELRAVIDRGDVWFDFPYTWTGQRKAQKVDHRPNITIYAKDGDTEYALARWPTTIGGWKPEKVNGSVRMLFKQSPPGERIWRDVIVSPVWIPPSSTPSRDLVRPVGKGRYLPKTDLFGPGYASAYGLVMMIHHRVDGPDLLTDQAIRTHGSVSYKSIDSGSSHGCHRLYNHMAVRLASFLLAHREAKEHGAEPLGFARSFRYRGKRHKLKFDSRGYRYELDPPVPIKVTGGRVRGKSMGPTYMPKRLPPHLARRFAAEMGN
jgi:hypothetical protein